MFRCLSLPVMEISLPTALFTASQLRKWGRLRIMMKWKLTARRNDCATCEGLADSASETDTTVEKQYDTKCYCNLSKQVKTLRCYLNFQIPVRGHEDKEALRRMEKTILKM